jgi:hypothetical protein
MARCAARGEKLVIGRRPDGSFVLLPPHARWTKVAAGGKR